jgi:hypothetical protein
MLPALATAAFLEMIGVNAHIEYTDTPYADVGKVLTDLAYIDVQSVRDAAPDPHNAGQWGYAMLADHGVKFDFFIPGWTTDLGAVQRSIDAFVKAHPGSVMAIEGPNEIENWPVSYHGHKDVAAAASFQRDLYARFHGDPLLDHVPVYDLTFSTGLAGLYPVLGDMDDACDVGTDHSYFGHGRLPGAELARSLEHAGHTTPHRPMAITETGYSTLARGVSEQRQATLTLDLLLDGAKLGAVHNFLYELLDEKADPAGNAGEQHFGLFRRDHTPKPVARALHDLSAILQAPARPPATQMAIAAVDGVSAQGGALLLRRPDHGIDLILWSEDKPSAARISFAGIIPRVTVFAPVSGTDPVAHYSQLGTMSLQVGADPTILRLEGR